MVPKLKDVDSCALCMARWIVKFSEEVPPPAAAVPLPSLSPSSAVAGFDAAMSAAKLPGPVADALLTDVVATGAVDVAELARGDWEQLPSWRKLRRMEIRRLLATLAL